MDEENLNRLLRLESRIRNRVRRFRGRPEIEFIPLEERMRNIRDNVPVIQEEQEGAEEVRRRQNGNRDRVVFIGNNQRQG